VKRKRIEVQQVIGPLLYFVLMRTKLGLNFMDKLGRKFPTFWKWTGYLGMGVGFLGMGAIMFELTRLTVNLFITQAAQPGVALVLPFDVPGAITVPFEYFIICVFIVAVIHEASHGIMARALKIKLKSSGFAFLGIIVPVIPAAFVEPDEKVMSKRPRREQLAVFAAGPFSNIVTGIFFLMILIFIIAPYGAQVYQPAGITISSLIDDGALIGAGVTEGEVIRSINGIEILDAEALVTVLGDIDPANELSFITDRQEYTLTPKDDNGQARLGFYPAQKTVVREDFKYGAAGAAVYSWIAGLFNWLQILSLGIGLMNLIPVGPVDGGRMFKIVTDS
jgi:Zn-dependent protease